jgi:hypothetical protein
MKPVKHNLPGGRKEISTAALECSAEGGLGFITFFWKVMNKKILIIL